MRHAAAFSIFQHVVEVVHVARGINETLRHRGLGVGEDIKNRPFFDDAPVFHHGSTVADEFHHVHLMRNDDDRNAESGIHLTQQFQNRARRLGVQGTRCFIAQQHLGVVRERTGNGNALLLAARQLRGIGFRFIRKFHEFQERTNLFTSFFGRKARQL